MRYPRSSDRLQRLGDHALTGERGVAVQRDRHHGEALFAEVEHVLLGPGDALQHRVDDLEVGRVRDQRDVDLAVAERADVLALGAQVVLHVTGAVRLARVHVALELAEDLRVGLADDVGQHVQPAAVRHPDDDLVHAVFGGLVQRGVQQGDDGLAALQGEPLLPDVLGLQEGLERLGAVQPAQDVLLLVDRRLLVLDLDPLLDPLALRRIHDVHVLDADGAAVGVAQHAEHVAQLHELAGR